MNYNNFRVLSCSTCNKKYGLHESEKLADEFILRLKQCSCGSKDFHVMHPIDQFYKGISGQ